ncbi:MAG: helix-turn-helix domain-containing protein [Nitrososphaerales archaeon]
MSIATLPKKETRWTSRLIRRLRGSRSLDKFASLLNVSVEEVELWENGQSEPDVAQLEKLSKLAECEQFLKDWKLAGSGELTGDLNVASQELSDELEHLLDERAQRLREGT